MLAAASRTDVKVSKLGSVASVLVSLAMMDGGLRDGPGDYVGRNSMGVVLRIVHTDPNVGPTSTLCVLAFHRLQGRLYYSPMHLSAQFSHQFRTNGLYVWFLSASFDRHASR